VLNITQIISFEISTECNLSDRHKHVCPIGKREKGHRELTDEIITFTAVNAYQNGFEGSIAFHFYNEPMLHHVRMFSLMEAIRALAPKSRFLLWTNGTILIKDWHLGMFEKTYISNYFHVPADTLSMFFSNIMLNGGGEDKLDKRLTCNPAEINDTGCGMGVHDFAINNAGDAHLCCFDWRNEVKIGNIFDSDLLTLMARKRVIVDTIWKNMSELSPYRCLTCTTKHELCNYDESIYQRGVELWQNT
jgi:radical SAM protein with 4Fe4S-binding SPASM domain